MQSDPLVILVLFGISAWVFKMWLDDYRNGLRGQPHPNAFPGALPSSLTAVLIGVAGALVILAAETAGEYSLGIVAEQSVITWLFLLAMISAAFFEELIFRGYLVVTRRGRVWLVGSILFFSAVFALLHPFLWELDYPEGVAGWMIWQAEWNWRFDVKGWFSTAIVFINSLWFYFLRFAPFNPNRSLVPCIAAHLASNLGVFLIKLMQGHVHGLY